MEAIASLLADPSAAIAGAETVRAYEDAATAIGRLDASGRLASAGFRELLVLRCVATAASAPHNGMIALLSTDGEGDDSLLNFGRAVREGTARARGGALPSVATLRELLHVEIPAAGAGPIDELIRDAHTRTPPVLKAALVALALGELAPDAAPTDAARLAGLAVTLVLCVGGAITDAWLTLPAPGHRSLHAIFSALAREARAAERGLVAARRIRDSNEERVRESLGRAAYSALDVLAFLTDELVITVPATARALGITPPTAGAAVARLAELGIAREVTGRARSREFVYEGLLGALAPEPVVRPA